MTTFSFPNLKDISIEVSVKNPTGRGARSPDVLLDAPPFYLDGQPLSEFLAYRNKTYDTYDGHNQAQDEDWYALHFSEPIKINGVEMTMECPNRDGGWWTSLRVEYWDKQQQEWQSVSRLNITPPYNFNDAPFDRRPYETHALIFDEVITNSVPLIGRPGGLAQFISLSYLTVFHRDLSRWNPTFLPKPPVPYIFRLIPPATIWDLSESLVKLTGISINVAYMDHYLDHQRYQRWWQRISHNYQGKPELWQLLGARIGWDQWNEIENPASSTRHESYVQVSFHNTIGRAIAPIVVDSQILGEMMSHQVVLTEDIDWNWHEAYAHDVGIEWEEYCAAIGQSPRMSLEQLEGAAELMGMIANTIANLAHRNLSLERELVGVRSAAE
jgi:hypothetical protein